MLVPKSVREVSYASCFGWFVRVEGCLSCEEDGQKTELGVERDSGQSSHVVLCQACEVLESAEDSLYRDAFPVGSPSS